MLRRFAAGNGIGARMRVWEISRRLYAVALAVIGWLAVATQVFLVVKIVTAAGRPPLEGIVNTLSYFTVSTNLLAALVATALALGGRPGAFLTRPGTVSAVTVYMTVVGLVYSLVLRALWNPTGLQQAADVALHDVAPILFALYWLVFTPKGELWWRQPAHWLIYPLAYMAYSLARGAISGLYLYPFADVTRLGYGAVLANTALLMAAFLALGLILVAIDRLIGRLRGPPVAPGPR